MVWEWIMGIVWFRINWWGDDTPVNQTSDYIWEVETLISGMVDTLVKIAAGIWFEIFGKWVW